MTITTNTTDRKALVKAIAEELGTTSTYLRAPTYAYQIGDFTVDRDGNIIGEDFTALQDFLTRNGYTADETDADPEEPAETQEEAPADLEAPVEAQPADSEETDDLSEKEAHADSEAREPITSMEISIPSRNATPTQLKNLTFMLYSRQTLLNRMTQSDCLSIPDSLIDSLRESTPETAEEFTSLLDDSKADGLTGFDCRDGKVFMTFPFDESQPQRWTTYANLLNRIFDAAMQATRISANRIEPGEENEKYLAHIWLQRLGYSGPDAKAERKVLLGHLRGYCAFSNGSKMQAHKDKYAAIRRERRVTEQEAAVLEVMAEEVTDNE